MVWTVTRQRQWPDGNEVVEISLGGIDYCNPDALAAQYPGEFQQYADPVEELLRHPKRERDTDDQARVRDMGFGVRLDEGCLWALPQGGHAIQGAGSLCANGEKLSHPGHPVQQGRAAMVAASLWFLLEALHFP